MRNVEVLLLSNMAAVAKSIGRRTFSRWFPLAVELNS